MLPYTLWLDLLVVGAKPDCRLHWLWTQESAFDGPIGGCRGPASAILWEEHELGLVVRHMSSEHVSHAPHDVSAWIHS